MTALQHAFQKAGVSVTSPGKTQYERIWLWLKDHPHQTPAEVASALHIKVTSAAAAVHDMCTNRGMLSRQRGTRFTQGVWEYSAVGSKYELQPRKFSHEARRRRALSQPPAEAPSSAKPPVSVEAPPTPKFDIDSYTLGELRAIYRQLADLFDRS